MTDTPSLCHRCGATLTPGAGDFYIVRIEAMADPSPPDIALDDLANVDLDAELQRLARETADVSQQELMDQVYRRLTIHLCRRCYQRWIEDPAGRGGPGD